MLEEGNPPGLQRKASGARRRALEVLGPWLLNKGDVLNLNAISQRLGSSYELGVSSNLGLKKLPPNPRVLSVKWRPDLGDLFGAVRGLSLRRSLSLIKRGVGLCVVSNKMLRRKGVLDGRDIVGLLDCSGFAYGDQWGTARMKRRAQYYERLKQKGLKLVLLPQALGPFALSDVREGAYAVLDQFDLVYARDRVSYEHALGLGLSHERLKVAPDITHLVEGESVANPEAWSRRVCLVPNARMVDKTGQEESQRYVDLMIECAQAVKARDLDLCFVVHERNDRSLVDDLRRRLGFDAPVFDEHALVTKGYLGACYAVVGSRYHALLSALSQATPCVGTSWNHKYEAMFADYGCSEMVVSPTSERAAIAEALEALLGQEGQATLRRQLKAAAQQQKDEVERMWQEVEAVFAPLESL